MLSFDFVPLDPLVPKLTTRLSADAQIPMTQQLTRIDYIIKSRIQAATGIKYILAVSIIKYLIKFITNTSVKASNFHIFHSLVVSNKIV